MITLACIIYNSRPADLSKIKGSCETVEYIQKIPERTGDAETGNEFSRMPQKKCCLGLKKCG